MAYSKNMGREEQRLYRNPSSLFACPRTDLMSLCSQCAEGVTKIRKTGVMAVLLDLTPKYLPFSDMTERFSGKQTLQF